MAGLVPFPTLGRVNRSLRKVAAAPLGIALLTLIFACDANDSAVTPATTDTISIDQPAVQLDIGSSTRLRLLQGSGDQRRELSGSDAVWTVQDPGVARVDAGVVTAIGVGSTRVMAVLSSRLTAWADIIVAPAPGSIELLTSGELTGVVGQPLSEPIRLFVSDRAGTPIAGAELVLEARSGLVESVSVRTDAEGVAESDWTLGSEAGSQVLDVRMKDAPGVRAMIVAAARPGEPVTVELSPTDATISPGQDVKFTATPRDAYGNDVADAELVWTTTNPLVATVDTNGLAAGNAAGDAEIQAALASVGTESAASNGNSGVGRGKGRLRVGGGRNIPAQVRDLSARAATATAITLQFTEVANGRDEPASYTVRYAYAVDGMDFGKAHTVVRGSCASPLQGQTVGSVRTCVVEGLGAGTGYEFQLVAFRNTGEGAVYGAPSNVAGATTNPAATAAALEIASGNHQTAQPGKALAKPVVARVRDAAGASLPGVAVRWTPLNGSTGVTEGVTDANGLVQVSWTLGMESGTQTLKASTAGVPEAAATATAASGRAVSIEVSPAAASVAVGSAVQLTARARDELGNVLSGVVFNWTSSNATVATVSSSGVVSGVGAGAVVITAAADGVAGNGSISVTSPEGPVVGGGTMRNEPGGLRALTNPNWSVMPRKEVESAPIVDRWFHVNRAGYLRLGNDGSDPLSPGGVLDFVYPTGFTSGGTEPAALETPLPGYTEMFVAFSFKLSENWYDHAARAGTPKIAFWWFPMGEGASNMFFLHRRLVDDGRSILEWGYTPANRARTDIRPGRWYTIELYLKLPSVPGVTSDGIKRWWVNGQLDGEHTNLFKMNNDAPGTPNAALSMFHFAPTWGGVGGPTVPAEQYIRIGHTYISGR
jgi:uncharacterized protein YjdB